MCGSSKKYIYVQQFLDIGHTNNTINSNCQGIVPGICEHVRKLIYGVSS